MRCLEIETNQVGLEEIEEDLLKRLQRIFNTKPDVAGILLMKLDHALRNWTTSVRRVSRITAEDVYAALAVDEGTLCYNHDLIPSEPFFQSRNGLVNKLETELFSSGKNACIFSALIGSLKKANTPAIL